MDTVDGFGDLGTCVCVCIFEDRGHAELHSRNDVFVYSVANEHDIGRGIADFFGCNSEDTVIGFLVFELVRIQQNIEKIQQTKLLKLPFKTVGINEGV